MEKFTANNTDLISIRLVKGLIKTFYNEELRDEQKQWLIDQNELVRLRAENRKLKSKS